MHVTRTICPACVIVDGALLLVRRARDYQELPYGRGMWELPGGAPEFGEDLAASVRRELAEEVGIALPAAVTPTVLDACAWCLEAAGVRSYRIAIVHAVALAAPPAIRLGEEVAEAAFFAPAAAAERIGLPTLAAVVRRHAGALARMAR